jgi:hypothetical protein
MPFKSQAQRGWMHANHPQMAKQWEAHTPAGKLPAKVGQSRQPRGQGGGGRYGGYVPSPVLRKEKLSG